MEPCDALRAASPVTVPTRIWPWSAVISIPPSAVPTVALPCEARSHRSPVVSTSTTPVELLMRVAPRRPTVRRLPTAISVVNRDPVGSSTNTSTESVGPGPIQLMRGRGPVMVTRWPSKSTLVSSTPRRSTAFAGLVADTVVIVSATSPAKAVDRRGVEETKVDFDGQRVTITGPRPRISWIGPGPTDSVEVLVELPTGSRFTAEIAVGNLRTVGRLGATRIKSSTGVVEVDTTGDLWLRASHGNATVGTAEGGIEITADHGQIRV